MNGQNEGCKVGMVRFNAARRVGPSANESPMKRMLVVAWAVGAMFMIQENAAAMEDVATGRWITRDTIVYNRVLVPKAYLPRPYRVPRQTGFLDYQDRFTVAANSNLFLESNPGKFSDPAGTSIIDDIGSFAHNLFCCLSQLDRNLESLFTQGLAQGWPEGGFQVCVGGSNPPGGCSFSGFLVGVDDGQGNITMGEGNYGSNPMCEGNNVQNLVLVIWHNPNTPEWPCTPANLPSGEEVQLACDEGGSIFVYSEYPGPSTGTLVSCGYSGPICTRP